MQQAMLNRAYRCVACRNIAMTFDTEKLEWFGYPMVKNIALSSAVFGLFDVD